MPDQPKKHVTIYADGAAEPNPGPGGYGIILLYGTARRELSGGFRRTTNNRMEIFAVIKALQSLKEPCQATVYSDSQYLVQAMNHGWPQAWQNKGWHRTRRKPILNADLWHTLLTLCQTHSVTFQWIQGHAGHPENERADFLSLQFLRAKNLPIDQAYESPPPLPAPASPTLTFLASPSPTPTTPSPPPNPAPLPITNSQFPIPNSQSPQSPALRQLRRARITAEGQPCRKCQTPVIKRLPHRRHPRPGHDYYEYYLYCPTCHTNYVLPEAKRPSPKPRGLQQP